jgi:hypothetical protein
MTCDVVTVNEGDVGGSQCSVASASPFVRLWKVATVRVWCHPETAYKIQFLADRYVYSSWRRGLL